MGGKSIAVSFGVLLGLVPYWRPVLIFGGMLFDVFYCDCHSASLFPVCCHIRNFLGMVIIKRGIAWNHRLNRDFVLCSDLEASCKVSNERLEITFPKADRRKYEYREYNI